MLGPAALETCHRRHVSFQEWEALQGEAREPTGAGRIVIRLQSLIFMSIMCFPGVSDALHSFLGGVLVSFFICC